MLYVTCTIISSVDLAHYEVSRAKDWVSVYCGTICFRSATQDVISFILPLSFSVIFIIR